MDANNSRKIKSDETLISILNHLQVTEDSRVSDIAEALDIAPSTAHGHLATLEAHGLITKTDMEYQLGLKFLDYGEHARRQHPLYEVTKETIEELANQTREKVWVIVEENGEAVYLNGASGEKSVKTYAREGQHTGLHHLAAGKAILSELPPERVKEIIETHGLTEKTEHTITNTSILFDELEEIRKRGVAFNIEESVLGLHAIGAPINDENGDVMGAISVSAPANRVTREKMESSLMEELKGTVNELEITLRYI